MSTIEKLMKHEFLALCQCCMISSSMIDKLRVQMIPLSKAVLIGEIDHGKFIETTWQVKFHNREAHIRLDIPSLFYLEEILGI